MIMLNNVQQNIANMVVSYFEGNTPTSEDIATKVKELSLFCNYNGDMDVIVRNIEARLNCSMEMGDVITDANSEHNKNWPERILSNEKIYSVGYEHLLRDKGMPPVIVSTISKINDEILGLLGDPKQDSSFQRRGLVIGDVQSGKTGNYLSLVTKAADAGYRFIIIIAGIHNNLRKQTQQRVDEGFIGRESLKVQVGCSKPVGVAKLNPNHPHPVSFTTQEDDFNSRFANQMQANIGDFSSPVVLVIKKNTNTLNSLYTWLTKYSKNRHNDKIDIPMLMIDDESDNASINTSQIGDDPTKTNGYLRKILHIFRQSCYVGYTATPFANIFMDPDSYDSETLEDLFPKDFIYSLNPPTNYFGPQKIFLNDSNELKYISYLDSSEVNEFFPKGHKKTLKIEDLPQSLKSAIQNFLIVKAIRNLRDQSNEHCSMLINVSTFVNVQNQIKNHVDAYIDEIRNELIINGKLANITKKSKIIGQLYDNYKDQFLNNANTDEGLFSWGEVLDELIDIFGDSPKNYSFKTFVVNSKSQDALDYNDYQKDGKGLMAITIGGFSLSRGLTIEGLTISYFYRSTKMYDTLLQMGRWFGYRPGYEDLCRIFMTEEAYFWYQHIANASQDLKDQVASMNQMSLTPRDFGLYVQSSEEGLMVTAKNKSRRGQRIELSLSFAGQLKELHQLTKDLGVQKRNLNLFAQLWGDLVKQNLRKSLETKQADVFQGVDTSTVVDFLEKFNPGFNDLNVLHFQRSIEYLDKLQSKYPKMDVTFITKNKTSDITSFADFNCIERKAYDKGELFYRLNKARVGGQEDEKHGLDLDQLESNEEKNRAAHYRRVRQKPLLLLYLVKIKGIDSPNDSSNLECIPTIALSFPYGDNDTKVTTILANEPYINSLLDSGSEEDLVGEDYE